MKAIVKAVFFNDTGLHIKGEIIEVDKIDANLMEPIVEETKPEKKPEKKETKKK